MAADPKPTRVKLEGEAYLDFKQQLHAADRWRCVACRRITGLTVHHLIPRSRQRLDTLENCVSLCVPCHERIQRRAVVLTIVDVQARIYRVADAEEAL